MNNGYTGKYHWMRLKNGYTSVNIIECPFLWQNLLCEKLIGWMISYVYCEWKEIKFRHVHLPKLTLWQTAVPSVFWYGLHVLRRWCIIFGPRWVCTQTSQRNTINCHKYDSRSKSFGLDPMNHVRGNTNLVVVWKVISHGKYRPNRFSHYGPC